MYEYKDNTYAEAGHVLIGNKAIGMWLPSAFAPFTEREIDITNLSVDDRTIKFDIFSWRNPDIRTYADAKKYIIQKRFSNDDQIAVMLNKDDSEEDALIYEKMQEWRAWSAILAHKIMEVISASQSADESH